MLSAASKVPKRDRLCRCSAVSHGLPSANTSPLSRFLAGSKVPKRHRLCRPNGHPLGLNLAGALLFRMGCPALIPPCFQRVRRCLNAIGSAGALLFRMGANTSPLSRFLAGSKVPKRHRLCRPNGHPLGLNPAGAVLFRMGCPAPIPLHSPGF